MKESAKRFDVEARGRGRARPDIPFQGFVAGTALSLAVWIGIMLLVWVLRI